MRFPGRYLYLLIPVFILTACDRAGNRMVMEGLTMGTTWNVTVSGTPEVDRQSLYNGIRDRLNAIDGTMSTYIEDSELSRINRSNDTGWIDISDDLSTVTSKAIEISHLTGGAFDITVGPLVNLWGFGPGETKHHVPDIEEIHAVLEKTGYSKLKIGLSPPGIKKTEPQLYLDLSGIAKGFAVDEIAALLESKNITDYMVDIGGEVRTSGSNPDGRAWRIGIEKPLTSERAVQRVIPLHNKAMATSGDYRNYFEHNGTRYSHTLDPRTGYPIRHTLASVSILHDSTMTADGLATALLVMGPTDGLEFATRNRLPAFFIIKTGDGFIEQHTEAFSRYLRDVEEN